MVGRSEVSSVETRGGREEKRTKKMDVRFQRVDEIRGHASVEEKHEGALTLRD